MPPTPISSSTSKWSSLAPRPSAAICPAVPVASPPGKVASWQRPGSVGSCPSYTTWTGTTLMSPGIGMVRNPAPARLVGRALGEFVVREKIGEGGFGEVYRAEQPALAREAVVKLLRGGHRARPEVVDRFLREARLA